MGFANFRRALGAFGAVALFGLQFCWADAARANEVMFHHFVLYKGMGSCGEWTDARARSPEKAAALEAYALGFATGYALWQDSDQHGSEFKFDNDYLFGRIDGECQAHPRALIINLVSDILHDEWEKTWRHDR